MKQNGVTALLSILYGIISSLLIFPIVALLRFLYSSLPLACLCVTFCFAVIFFFILIKLIFTKRAYSELCKKQSLITEEIQEIYINKEAFIKALSNAMSTAQNVDIMDLRGFIFTQQDSPLFSLLSTSTTTDYRILLSQPDSSNTSYRASCMQGKPIAALKSEINASFKVLLDLKKSNIKVRAYSLLNAVRLIFVDETLFMTPFRQDAFLSSAPTFKIPSSSAMFKCYKAFFSEMWDKQSKEIV